MRLAKVLILLGKLIVASRVYSYTRDLFLYAMRHGFMGVVYACNANGGYGCATQGWTIDSTRLVDFTYYMHRE